MSRVRPAQRTDPPGLATRRIAADILDGVLRRGRQLDEQLDGTQAHAQLGALPERDRALARRLVATVLRRRGTLNQVLTTHLERGFPREAPRVETALLLGAAQILWLDVPDHAAVDLAVHLVRADRRAGRYAGLVNAVLRRVAVGGQNVLAKIDSVVCDTPAWLFKRWMRSYGETTARAIAAANAHEPSLDLTVKEEPQSWAIRLGGRVLATGSVRTPVHGPVSQLPGFAEGAWWVQDAAAALPARLFGPIADKSVADLCAAPGGKTAQLALAGARVTAIDRSANRLARLADNLARLHLSADMIEADAAEWDGGPFDAVLLDAPCSSTGTIRRHPDIPWLKREADISALAAQQIRLLDRAITLLKPGGVLVYCTCSLEPEEGEGVIDALVEREPRIRRRPIMAHEVDGLRELLTSAGDLRTLPCHLPDPDPRMAGLDGFYAARLEQR